MDVTMHLVVGRSLLQVTILSNLFFYKTSLQNRETLLNLREISLILGMKNDYQTPPMVRFNPLMDMIFNLKTPKKTNFPSDLPKAREIFFTIEKY